jgi:hypothetical protein
MNNMHVRSRASHKEIMERLSRLLGGTAVNVVATAVPLRFLSAGDAQSAAIHPRDCARFMPSRRGILKSSIRLTFCERIQASAARLPMGSFLHKHKRELLTKLSGDLYELLLWLDASPRFSSGNGCRSFLANQRYCRSKRSTSKLDLAGWVWSIHSSSNRFSDGDGKN